MTIVDEIIKKEGTAYTNDPADRGGPTKFGITQATLSWYRKTPVTPEDVKALTLDEAKAIYQQRYILGPKFNLIQDLDISGSAMLYSNIVDFGVMSGPQLAIIHLQEILSVPADGVLGPQTLGALQQSDLVQVNKQLVSRRCLMAARLCKKDPTQVRFLVGWLQRFLSFL